MNLAKKIIFSGASDVVITFAGFLGTLYFARVLGPGPLGTYALVLTVVNWFVLVDLGVNQAATKRISAGTDQEEFLTSVVLIYLVQMAIGVAVLFTLRDRIGAYIGGPFVLAVVAIFVCKRLYQLPAVAIKGIKRVYVVDIADAIEQVMRVIIQVSLVAVGYYTASLVYGHLIGVAVSAALLGVHYATVVRIGVAVPERKHFRSLYEYIRYSWLNAFRTQTVSKMDITILGFFVANDVIGVYTVAWTMAMTLQMFASAVSRNIFPEISEEYKAGNNGRIQAVVTESLTSAGVFPIPGIVGAILLGDEALSIYGQAFTYAGGVLPILAGVALVRSFDKTLTATLNGIDRPDINFWANVAFMIINVMLNVFLIPLYGIIGAGVATLVSVSVSMLIRWIHLLGLVALSAPVTEIGKQTISAGCMALVVFMIEQLISPEQLVGFITLVVLGAVTYFAILIGLSTEIRSKFQRVFGTQAGFIEKF